MDPTDELARLLGEAYDMERKLIVALDEMARDAGDRELSRAFAEHRRATEGQAQRVQAVFGSLGMPASTVPCSEVDDLIREHRAAMCQPGLAGVERDIAAARSAGGLERFEMAVYRHVESVARTADASEQVLSLLRQNHVEESEAAARLDALAGNLAEKSAAEAALFRP